MPAMRRLHLLLLAVVAILAVKWTGALSVAAQNCCHPSASKADGPATAPATRVAPTSSFGAEDVRKEFNAFVKRFGSSHCFLPGAHRVSSAMRLWAGFSRNSDHLNFKPFLCGSDARRR